jgi:tRNA(adenine34) deaminase
MTASASRLLAKWLFGGWARRLRLRRMERSERLAALGLQTHRQGDVSEIDIAMMKRAIELGRKAAAIGEVPVGAVVYRGSQIFAEGYNIREAAADPTGHAELIAMSLAGKKLGDWRLTDCSLAVTLEPCPMCAGAMVNARLGRVIYGATDPKAGACHTLYRIPTDARLNHRVEVIAGVMAEECGKLLKDFFQHRRRVNKETRQARSA